MPKTTGFDFKSNKPLTDVDSLVKKYSALKPDFITLNKLPEATKKENKKNKNKSQRRQLPPEVLTDLKVLRMRSVLDTKRFYKRSSLKSLTTGDVQIGKVIDSPADFYSSRLTKKERKRTLVDELLANQDFKKEVKKRYVDIVTNHKRKFKREYRMLQQKQKKGKK